MSEQAIERNHGPTGEDGLERDARRFRDGSIIGAVALEGAALLEPGLSTALMGAAVISLLAAGGFEHLRHVGRHRRTRSARL